MTRAEIEQITNDFLVEEIEIDVNLLKPEALLKDDMGIDSLDFVDIVVIVERNFGFKIKAEEIANINTLGGFYDYIEQKLIELGR